MNKRVLIVDDSLYMRATLSAALSAEGYEIVGQAADGASAIEMALELQPDLITLDNILPDMIGIEILRILKHEEELQAVFIMISAVGQDTIVAEGLSLGAAAYIVKPFTTQDLLKIVNREMSLANSK